MANELACPNCHKRYTFGAKMAGKRVRCRQCSTIFTVELDPAQLVGAADTSGLAPPGPVNLHDTQSGLHDTQSGLSETHSGLNDSRSGRAKTGSGVHRAVQDPAAHPGFADVPPTGPGLPAAGGDLLESQFEQAFNAQPAEERFRRNTQFKFPWAAQLDDWLPTSLIVLGFLWMILETFRPADAGPIWTGILRLVLIVTLFLILAVPLPMLFLRKVAARLRFELPPTPVWRAAAVFALPVTLGYVFWSVGGGSVGTFVVGCVLGLAVGAGAFWFLFRLEPNEIGPSYAAAAGGFVGATIASVLILLVVNAILNTSLKSSGVAASLHGSPLGPGFVWDVNPTKNPNATPDDIANPGTPKPKQFASAQSGARNTNNASSNNGAANGQDAGNSAASKTDPPVNPPVQSNDVSAVPVSNASQGQPTGTDATANSGATHPEVASTDPPQDPSVKQGSSVFDLPPDAVESHPQSPKTADTAADPDWIATLHAKALPFVKDVHGAKELGAFDEVIYPTASSKYFAIVRHKDAQQDMVECRDAQTLEQVGAGPFPRDSAGDPNARRYALSPDGTLVAGPTKFPKAGFEIRSITEQKSPRFVAIPSDANSAELIGFMDNDRLVAQCFRGAQTALAVWSLKGGDQPLYSILLPAYMHAASNGEMSPDGKFFAFATRMPKGPCLMLVDITRPTAIDRDRALPINGLDARWAMKPVGIAFSPDASHVAALFAQGGEGFLISWNIKGVSAKMNTQLVPNLPPQVVRGGESGRVLEWVGNNAWIIGGDAVISATDGRVLANLADESIKSEHRVGKDLYQLLYGSNGTSRMAVVQLDPIGVSTSSSARQ